MSYQDRDVVPMGTIIARKRRDGSTGFTAQILLKKDGKIVFREAKTFDSKREASAWIGWRETELKKPAVMAAATAKGVTLGDAIKEYVTEKTDIGRTKAQCLNTIAASGVASLDCASITAADISSFARELLDGGRKPQTVGNYISHLAAVFRDAKPLWGIPLNYEAMREAQAALTRQETIAKSDKRDRRPTLEELDLLMTHFSERQQRAPHSAPMVKIVAFAIFSTRRQEEITRIQWADLDEAHSRIMVRDMKHPGQKRGNNVWCELTPEALAIVRSMSRDGDLIFPYTTDAISAGFTRACQFLEIKDLHFHDLRHEGVSRLFEMGRTIPQAASVSGHRSWTSLQRYSHMRETGDRFANWPWLEKAKEKL